jgi:hypothetical protein
LRGFKWAAFVAWLVLAQQVFRWHMKLPGGYLLARCVLASLVCTPAAADEGETKGSGASAILEAFGVSHKGAVVMGEVASGGSGIYGVLYSAEGKLKDRLTDLRAYKKLGFNEVQMQSLKVGDVVLFCSQDLAEFHDVDRLARPGVVQPLYFRFTDEAGRTSHLTANMKLLAQGIVRADMPVMEMRTGTGERSAVPGAADADSILAHSPAARIPAGVDVAKSPVGIGAGEGMPASIVAGASNGSIAVDGGSVEQASGIRSGLGVPFQVGSAEARLGEESGLVRALSISGKYVRLARVAVVVAAAAALYACYRYYATGAEAPAVPAPRRGGGEGSSAAATIASASRGDPSLNWGSPGGLQSFQQPFLMDKLSKGMLFGTPPAPVLPPIPEIKNHYVVAYYLNAQGRLVNFAF